MTEKKKPEGRPSKKVLAAIEKHEAPKLEIQKPPAGKEEKKALAILDEGKQAFFVYKGLIAGKSIEEIAEDLKITPAGVRQHVGAAIDNLNQELSRIKLNWTSITMARTEEAMKVLMSKLDQGIISILDWANAFDKIEKIQERVLGTGASTPQNGPGGTNINIIQTVDSGSELYNRGMARMQIDYAGKTVPALEEYATIDEDVEKLSGLLSDD